MEASELAKECNTLMVFIALFVCILCTCWVAHILDVTYVGASMIGAIKSLDW